MEAYYSSDDDVAWGPVTLREIKADLKKPALRKPNRRHTLTCEQTIEDKKMSKPNVISDESILEISAYLTASEAASMKQDTYYTTEENSIKVPLNKSYEVNKNPEKSPLGFNEKDTSCLNFVRNAMGKPSDIFIKNEHLTLMESPNNSVGQTDIDIIEISSDEEAEQFKEKANLSCVWETSNDSVQNSSYYTEKDCSKHEELCEMKSYCKDSDDLSLDHSINSHSYYTTNVNTTSNSNKIDNVKQRFYQVGSNNDTNLPLDQSAMTESKYPFSPALTIPEMDLEQFDDSSIGPFNDTLEKINAILNQAGDISLTESSNVVTTNSDDMNRDMKTSPICKESISGNDHYSQSCNLISGSFIQKPISDLPSTKTCTKYHTPMNHLAVKSHIPLLKRSPDLFKLPTLPLKSPDAYKLPILPPKSKSNFKDIVSPVRMYINYSPKPVLKRNVKPVETKPSPKFKNSQNKENDSGIPSVIYKPSKNPILGSERAMCLPTSLEKMVIKSTVIKHERNPVSVSLFKKDISLDSESELTRNSFNDSQLSDQNMSVLHKMPAYRK